MYKLPEAELHDLKERIESRQGLRQLSYMKEMKMGGHEYKLVAISECSPLYVADCTRSNER